MRNVRHRQQAHSVRQNALMVISLIAFLSVIIYGGVWIWAALQKPSKFPIDKVLVRGQLSHVSPAEVAQIVKQYATGSFFALNLSEVETHLLQIPWVTQVSFRRVWPHTLVVDLVEQTALARFGDRGVMNIQGMIFYPDPQTISMQLPFLSVPPDQAKNALQMFRALTAVANTKSLSIHALVLNDEQSWVAQLGDNIVVVLGASDMLPRFQRFMRVYSQLIQSSKQPISRIDLRYPNGFAVQYRK